MSIDRLWGMADGIGMAASMLTGLLTDEREGADLAQALRHKIRELERVATTLDGVADDIAQARREMTRIME